MQCLWTSCANLHQNWFICFQNITFASLVRDEGMNGEHLASTVQSGLVEA